MGRMGRRSMKELLAIKDELRKTAHRFDAVYRGLSKSAQPEDDPPAEPPATEGGGEDPGDDFDEGTTGEEGADLGDLGDLGEGEGEGGEGDFGGDPGGGFGGGGFGGGPGGGGGFGEDVGVEDAQGDADTDKIEGDVSSLRTEMEAVKRTLVDISKALGQIRNPLGDPMSGNNALQSV